MRTVTDMLHSRCDILEYLRWCVQNELLAYNIIYYGSRQIISHFRVYATGAGFVQLGHSFAPEHCSKQRPEGRRCCYCCCCCCCYYCSSQLPSFVLYSLARRKSLRLAMPQTDERKSAPGSIAKMKMFRWSTAGCCCCCCCCCQRFSVYTPLMWRRRQQCNEVDVLVIDALTKLLDLFYIVKHS